MTDEGMTPPTSALERARDEAARIVDPLAFKSWEALYQYCIKNGDTEEWARNAADSFHRKAMDEALAKADAILAPALLALARRAEAAEKALRNIVEHFGNRVDAPGHCHDKPGIWDADNAPGIAGTACEWCAQWTAARALITPIAEGR